MAEKNVEDKSGVEETMNYEVKTYVQTLRDKVEVILKASDRGEHQTCQNQEKDPSNDEPTELKKHGEFDEEEKLPRIEIKIDCKEDCKVTDGSGASNRRKTKLGLVIILLVALIAIAGLASFLVTKSKNKQQLSKIEQLPCQEDSLRTHSWEPQLQLSLSGLSQEANMTEQEQMNRAVLETYNLVAGGCAGEYQRLMYDVSVANQSLEMREVPLDGEDETTGTSALPSSEEVEVLVVLFQMRISCNDCSEDLAFASKYPDFFYNETIEESSVGGNLTTRRRHLYVLQPTPDLGDVRTIRTPIARTSGRVRGEEKRQATMQLYNHRQVQDQAEGSMEDNRLDAASIMENLDEAFQTSPILPNSFRGILDATVITSAGRMASTRGAKGKGKGKKSKSEKNSNACFDGKGKGKSSKSSSKQ